jgi:acetylglutamate kinase
VGLFGVVTASKKAGPWGLVGTDIQARIPVLEALLSSGQTPVVPTLALGPESLLNVNGDETAAGLAVALKAAELVFLTDVEGVKNGNGRVFDTAPSPEHLLKSDFVSGGMVPKLRAVQAAINAGVPTVRVGRTIFASTT